MIKGIYRRYKPKNEDEKNFLGENQWELLLREDKKRSQQVAMYEKFSWGLAVVKILKRFGIEVEVILK